MLLKSSLYSLFLPLDSIQKIDLQIVVNQEKMLTNQERMLDNGKKMLSLLTDIRDRYLAKRAGKKVSIIKSIFQPWNKCFLQ